MNCHVCAVTDIPSVSCLFKGCLFKTNVYGTFKSHKSRKHLTDFKEGTVQSLEVRTISDDTPPNKENKTSLLVYDIILSEVLSQIYDQPT